MREMQVACAVLVAGMVLTVGLAAAAQGRRKDQPPTTEEKAALVRGNNEFALGLYARLRGREGNLFFSPYSISTALAMTHAGARGETADQMARVLRFAVEPQRLHPAFSDLMDEVNAATQAEGCELHVANALWGQEGYDFLAEFLALLRDDYGAELTELDFAGAAETARRTINAWVEEQTEGKIKDLIAPGVLNALTRLVLTNAIYFKGAWAEPFNERRTRDEPFWLSPERSVTVPMMNQMERLRYGEFDECQVLEIPYAGDAVSMVILLPKERDGLAGLEQALTLDELVGWLPELRERQVAVALPRFKLTSQFRLGDTLKAMGMADAFSVPPADLSGMNGRTDLFISAVIHKAFVDVNEKGTEAAAATAVVVALAAGPVRPQVFRADHPFIFLIRHAPTGSILFLGRLTDPKEQGSS